MYLVGQEKNKGLVDNGKLDNANFIIIKGPSGYGKTYLTKYIANHYDMEYMQLDYKVDTIRQLVSSSNNNNNVLYHFKDFDKSSPAAKAALLKIAEETPKGVKLVVTTSAYNLLDTLISRAYVLDMVPYNSTDIDEYSKVLEVEDSFMDRLYGTFEYLTPTLLYKLKNMDNVSDILDIAQETIDALNRGLQLEDVSKIAAKFWKDDKEGLLLYLDILSKSSSKLLKRWGLIQYNVEKTKAILNRTAVGNYRNLVHNMLMEMV